MSKDGTSFTLSGADGIRAFACLAVIAHHLSQKLTIQIQPTEIREAQSFLLLGNTGVSVFFVLSGFLLSYPFWKQFLNDGQYPDIRQYTVRRAARIMPGYYVSFIISTVLVVLLGVPSEHFWIRLLSGLTFTSGFHYITFFPNELNSPFWSVSFEVFCYLLMPVFMFIMFKLFKTKRTLVKALVFWAGVAVVIALLNRLIHVFLTPDDFEKGWEFGEIGGAKYWMPNYNPIGFFGHFMVGIIASGVTTRLYKGADAVSKFKKAFGFDIIAAVGIIGAILFLWNARHAPDFALSFQNQPYFFPFYALFFGIALAAAPHSNFMGKLLDNPFSRMTAKLSFGLYIWHYLIMGVITTVFIKNYTTFGIADVSTWALISLAVIVMSYAVAALSYKFIEKPILDRAHQWRFDAPKQHNERAEVKSGR